MKLTIAIILTIACLAVINADLKPVDQFIANYEISAIYSSTFADGNDWSASQPFLSSPLITPFDGKFWFDWKQQGFKVLVTNGPGSPLTLDTTYTSNSVVNQETATYWNLTTYAYWSTDGGNACVYTKFDRDFVPKDIMNMGNNMTIIGTATVDGFSCLKLEDDMGFIYYVRITDLVLIQASSPFFLSEEAPFMAWLGTINATTNLTFSNVAAGPVNPKEFAAPSTTCKFIDYDIYMESVKDLGNLFKSISQTDIKETIKQKMGKLLGFDSKQQPQEKLAEKQVRQERPKLLQTFTANWVMSTNASTLGAFTYNGMTALDFEKGGFVWAVKSVSGNIPFNFATEFVMSPGFGGVEFLEKGTDGSCYSYLYLQWLFMYLIPSYDIPPSAYYLGTDTVNGVATTKWALPNGDWYTYTTTIWVGNDGSLQKMTFYNFQDAEGFYEVLFSDIVPSVDPSLYARPTTCSNLLTFNHNYESHLPWAWCDPWC